MFKKLVAIDPVGNQELDVLEFIQESKGNDNIVYLIVSGDKPVPPVYIEETPSLHDKFNDELTSAVTMHYVNLGFNVELIEFGSLVSPLY